MHPKFRLIKFYEWNECCVVDFCRLNISKNKICQKSCGVLQYNGKVVYDDVYSWGEKNRANFAYEIDPPEEVTVFQEYVVYDTIGMNGSVGGTLGMFIGFSFTGFISSIINRLSKLKNKFTVWTKSLKSSFKKSNHLPLYFKINSVIICSGS